MLSDAEVVSTLEEILGRMRFHAPGHRASQTTQQRAELDALDAAIERFGVCECPRKHRANVNYCLYCGKRVPDAP